MPTKATSKAALRRARISRQFRQTHDSVSAIFTKRLTEFFAALRSDVVGTISRAASTPTHVDQIFNPQSWGPMFLATIKPPIRTAAFTGASFEREWIESATAAKTTSRARQSAMMFSGTHGDDLNHLQNPTHDASFQGVLCTSDQKSQVIRESQNLFGISADFSSFAIQKGPGQGAFGFLPDISVEMSAELQAETERFLRYRTVGVWSKVSATLRSQLQKTIQEGLRDGDDLKAMTQRIQFTLNEKSKYIAQRIARTETTAAMGFGGHAERTELGISHKEWVSTIDNRNRGANPKSRFDHLTCAGQTVKNDEPFTISGELLNYPGDITLGATGGNVIHCRCAAVGAWPTGALAGAGYKPGGAGRVADPVAGNPQLSVKDRAIKTADDWRANNPIVKQLISKTVKAMADAFDRTESIRKKAVEIHDEIVGARKKYRDATKAASEVEKRIQDLRDLGGDPGEIKRLKKELKKLENTQEKAEKSLLDIESSVRDEILPFLKAKSKAYISVFEGTALNGSEAKKSANKASTWLSGITEESAVGTSNMDIFVNNASKNGDRAYYSQGAIHLAETDSVQTAVHELGHHLETLNGIGDIGLGFLLHRTQNRGSAMAMTDLNSAFKDTEIYWDDEFQNAFGGNKINAAYAGKYYHGSVHTEVISMGVELLYSNPLLFARSDPEWFRFIVGLLKGWLQ